jgi:hypothetical protein
MPDMATLLGTPLDFDWGGKVYKVHPRDLDIEGRFCQWCKNFTLEEIQSQAQTMLPGVLDAMLTGHRHDIASRFYEFTAFIPQRVLASEPGKKHLAFLQLGKADRTIRPALLEQVWKDPQKRRELLGKMKEASGEVADPNWLRAPGEPLEQPELNEAGPSGEEDSPAG